MKKYIVGNVLVLFAVLLAMPPVSSAQQAQEIDLRGVLNKFREERGIFLKAREDVSKRGAMVGKAYMDKGKGLLMRTSEVLEKRGQQLSERLNIKSQLYSPVREELLSEITDHLSRVREITAKIQNAGSAEELKAIALQLQEERQKHQQEMRRGMLVSHISRFEESIIRVAQERATRIEGVISSLKDSGKDVAQLEDWLSQAREKISRARSAIAELKTDATAGDIGEISQIQEKLKGIKDMIKEAYQLFRNIASSGNALSGNATSSR